VVEPASTVKSRKVTSRAAWLSAACAAILLALLATPVIVAGSDVDGVHPDGAPAYTTSEAGDAAKYHLPVIRSMAEQWPDVDIVHYRSATSPGYHLAMAAALRAGADEQALRWINLVAGCVLVGVVAAFAGVVAGLRPAVVLSLPLVVSPYVLASSCWVTTDNAALAFVALAVACAAFGGGSARASVVGGASATLAVAIRQLHIWPIAPLALSVKAGAGLFTPIPVVRRITAGLGLAPDESAGGVRRARMVVGAIALLAPVALLGFFVWKWQGLMPPAYRDKHASGISWAMPALSLSLAAVFAGPLLAGAWEGVRTLRLRDPWVWLTFGVGLAAAVIPETAWSSDAGRTFGWMWEVARRAPSVADRSLLFVALAPLGALSLLAHWRAARANGRARAATILLFAGACWCAAQMANAQAWQRYAEPPVLAGAIWLASVALPSKATRAAWPRLVRAGVLIGPLAIAAWLALVSAVTIYVKVF